MEIQLASQHRVDILDRLYTHLRRCAALSSGMSWGWIDRNPADHAHPPKLPSAGHCLRSRSRLPSYSTRPPGPTMSWPSSCGWRSVTSGARCGELVALRWVDVDFDQGLLRINSNYVAR